MVQTLGWLSAAAACASALETGALLAFADSLKGQKFQSDGAFEFRVLGLVDDTHAAPADFG